MPGTRSLLRPRCLAAVALVAMAAVGLTAAPAVASGAAPSRDGWAALPGDTSDFEFRSFDAEYTLERDASDHATLEVVETAVAVFPSIDQNRGIIRSIPDYYGEVFLDTQVLGVTDENGDDVYYEVQRDGGFTILLLGDDTFVHGATTYVIHYTQTDTIRAFADTGADEFYWDVNGTGWEQPFGEVNAALTLGPDLSEALNGDAACYEGAEGSSTVCSEGIQVEQVTAGTLVTAGSRNLGPGENLSIAVGFEPGTFVEGEAPAPVDLGPPPPIWAVLLGLLGGAVSFVGGIVGAVVLRRPRTRPTGFIVPQYSVPDGFNIMIAAEFIGRRDSALQAQLVSLAVNGKLRLLGYPVVDAENADYAVQLIKTDGLDSWEQAVVDALFGAGAAVGAVRDLQRSGDSELADALRPLVAALPGTIPASGFEGPKTSTPGGLWFVLGTIAATALGFVGAFFAGWVGVLIGVATFFFGMIGIIIAAVAARRRVSLSPLGAERMDYLLGMKMYLELAEQDRFEVLQSATGAERIDTNDGRQVVKLYEKLLPWAVIWGIEDSWARELEIQLQRTGEQLDWYAGPYAFQSYHFTSMLSGVNSGINPPVSTAGSSWSGSSFSSFSGGSSGGGFSGGGGGGGGGGGR
jgi:uncharacterized membrane protein YgcG